MGMGESAYERLSRDELSAAISRQKEKIAADFAEYYAMVREADRRPELVPRAPPGAEAQTFLRELGAEAPAEDVRIARLLGELPQLASAFAAGEAGHKQVKVAETAVRTIRRADPEILDDATLTQVDTHLAAAARDL